ncbi:MAG: tRNA pseudouridine(55) synthase TruB [Deltaproteobacteria bacterium]|nr:tRNA pseudouridine(55) synthase TruB [Deltaproteobacteria bacterium]
MKEKPDYFKPDALKPQTQSSGFLILDKPAGMSSAKLVSVVKKTLGVRKMGHTGTLDPFATGVMVCCVNQATKLAQYFLVGSKSYEATLCLGVETDTQDATGQVVATSNRTDIPKETIRLTLSQFVGQIEQVPPVYSALKHKGKPLYRLARQGAPIRKPARPVQIHALRILDMNLPLVRFSVSCGAGTYIRTLCHDIGLVLECGGHLKHLVRTESCGFKLSDAISLATVKRVNRFDPDQLRMVSMADALMEYPEWIADNRLAQKIRFGQPVGPEDFGQSADSGGKNYIKVVDTNRRLLAVLRSVENERVYEYGCVLNP